MSKLKTVRKNMVMNILLTLSSVLFPLITYPYITRVLLPDGMGKIYLALSVLTYFSMFAQLGVPVYGVRATAFVREDKLALSKLVKELLSINLLMCIPVYIVFALAIVFIPQMSEERNLFLIMGVSILLNAVNTDWFYQGIERYTYITIRSVVLKLIALIAMFMLVHQPGDYIIYGAISIFANSASSIVNIIGLKNYVDNVSITWGECRKHGQPVISFFMLSVMTTIYTNLDVVMLGFMTNDANVGYYGTAVKIKLVLVAVITAASSVLLPRLSYYQEKGEAEDFKLLIQETTELLLLISIPAAMFFAVYARESILVLAGELYTPAILCMQIIMPCLVLIALSNIIGLQILAPLGREKQSVIAVSLGAAADVVLNLILIPLLQASGAAIGTLSAEIIVLIYLLICSRDLDLQIFKLVSIGKLVLAASIATALSLVSRAISSSSIMVLIVSSLVFAIVYFVILYSFKERIIRSIVKR